MWAEAACQLRCSIQIGLLRSRLYLVSCIVACILCCTLRQFPFCSRISAFVSRMQIEFVDVVAGSCDVFALLSSCRLRLSLIGRTSIVFPSPTHTHTPHCVRVCAIGIAYANCQSIDPSVPRSAVHRPLSSVLLSHSPAAAIYSRRLTAYWPPLGSAINLAVNRTCLNTSRLMSI